MNKIHFGKENFISKYKCDLLQYYEFKKKLGKGGHGKVFEIINRITKEKRACKQIKKSKIKNKEQFEREINILMKADHINIIKLYEVYEDENYLNLIMEECKGGSLFDKLVQNIKNNLNYTEHEISIIFSQIMSVILYCHSNNICHRDLKPENILFSNEGESLYDNPIKVIDFDLSSIFSKKKMETQVGTAYYIAPEVLKGKYNESCDIWSAGVILYILLSGEPPFYGQNNNEIYKKIIEMKFDFPEDKWSNISKSAKDLIKKMIAPEEKRINAHEVLEHKWFKHNEEKSNETLNLSFKSLKNFVNSNDLKKLTLTFIASRLNNNEINNLNKIFKAFDKENNGSISLLELKNGLIEFKKKMNVDEIINIFDSIDCNKNGKIDYSEFIAATIDKKIYLDEEKLFEAFNTFDKDKNGKISKDDFEKILKDDDLLNDENIKKIISEVDKNKDGYIDYNEFLAMMEQ